MAVLLNFDNDNSHGLIDDQQVRLYALPALCAAVMQSICFNLCPIVLQTVVHFLIFKVYATYVVALRQCSR